MLSTLSYGAVSKRQAGAKTSDVQRECLKLLSEVEAKNREIAELREQKAAGETIRKAQDEQIGLYKKVIEFLDDSIKKLKQAGAVDNQVIGELKEQKRTLTEDLKRVRAERDRANGRLKKVGTAALVVGIGIGIALVKLVGGE